MRRVGLILYPAFELVIDDSTGFWSIMIVIVATLIGFFDTISAHKQHGMS